MYLKYLTFDSGDTASIAQWWAALLGAPAMPTESGHRVVTDDQPWMLFLPVPESKTAKNRFHADYDTGDIESVRQAVMATGGTVFGDHLESEGFLAFRDPDGNEFCVVQKDDMESGLTLVGPTIDCAKPESIAGWWADVLEGTAAEHPLGFAVQPPVGPRWLFTAVPEDKTAKNRCHPDLHTSDFDAQVARVIDLGAVVTARLKDSSRFVVFDDPDGNEFCIVEDVE